jgi:hypothetical protein
VIRELNRFRLGVFGIILALLLTAALYQPAVHAGGLQYWQFQKGMTFEDSNNTNQTICECQEQQSLEALAATGTNWVAVTVVWYQSTYTNSSLQPDASRTPTDATLIHLIQTIHALGMRVMLKLGIGSKDGMWSAKIEPKDVGTWFESYQRFASHYAELAQAGNVEMFCIGTELNSMTQPSMMAYWLGIIEQVRRVFINGYITYAADWQPDYWVWHELGFWKALDYVGIDAYFPLTEKNDPTVPELNEAWQRWMSQIEDWQNMTRKQIILTEVGYRNQEGTNTNPGSASRTAPPDQQEQANCYEALLETFWGKPWLRGIFFQDWRLQSETTPTDYTIWGRLAEDIMDKWYAKPFIPDGTPSDAVPALVGIQEAESALSRAYRENRTVGLQLSEDALPAAIHAYEQGAIIPSEIMASIAKSLADSAMSQRIFVDTERLGVAFVVGVTVGTLCMSRHLRAYIRSFSTHWAKKLRSS